MLDYFHSSSANIPGSSNISGFQNPAMDEVIRKILACRNRADLMDAVKTLDRIICANHYVIPRWYIPADRLAFWNRFGYPANLSTRISPPDYTVMMYWWVDAEKDAALRKAMADGRKLSFPPPATAAPRVDKALP
jgi:microcin C transport system substrate-binding protein